MSAHTIDGGSDRPVTDRSRSRVELLREVAVLTVLVLLALGMGLLQKPDVANVNAKDTASATIARTPANRAAQDIDRAEPEIEYSGTQGHYKDESTEQPPTF
jgi:hypothetical protein